MGAWKTYPAVERGPEKVTGAWVFRGALVPVPALFENLRNGATIDQFPGVVPRRRETPDLGRTRSRAGGPDRVSSFVRILVDQVVLMLSGPPEGLSQE